MSPQKRGIFERFSDLMNSQYRFFSAVNTRADDKHHGLAVQMSSMIDRMEAIEQRLPLITPQKIVDGELFIIKESTITLRYQIEAQNRHINELAKAVQVQRDTINELRNDVLESHHPEPKRKRPPCGLIPILNSPTDDVLVISADTDSLD